MSLPNQVDPTTPTGSSARSLGDDQIRALKQAIIDIFGLPSAIDISSAVATINSSGQITSLNISASSTPIRPNSINFDTIANLASLIAVKGSNPGIRVIGSEASAKDWRILESQGNIIIDENTGSEAIPTWSRRIIIGSTSGNILWYSGGSFTVELDHAATANRVITIPDATDTLVNLGTAQTLSAKGLSGVTALSMAAAIGITPAAVSGTPAQHGLFQENVVKAWVTINVAAGTPSLTDSFNVTSIADTAVGRVTITWDRDFVNTTYAIVGSCILRYFAVSSADTAIGSAIVEFRDDVGALVDISGNAHVIAIGDQ